MEDAISQLKDLGVTRGQAKKALARYNNDVARAADYIFSGNIISDDEAEETMLESDEALAIRLSAEEQEAVSNPFQEKVTTEKAVHQPPQQPPVQDSSTWSVVPFTPKENLIIPTTVTKETANINNNYSLTWWEDPQDPSQRAKYDNEIPIALRPPSYHFAYSPILLESLFHISLFRYVVLSFRPVSYAWGSPKGYWRGFGEPIPGYIMKKITKQHKIQDTTAQDLISFDDFHLSDHEEQDAPPYAVESAQEEQVEYVDHEEDELLTMPVCLKALCEMQKIFAFLSDSKRSYGNTSHFVKALNVRASNGWDMSGWEETDKTYEIFLEMVTNFLVEADKLNENTANDSPSFQDLFKIKAKIEYGSHIELESVNYITICTDKHMRTFHDCLDSLVYESYEKDEEADPDSDNDDNDGIVFKLTTFQQIPPIIMVSIESRTGPKENKYIVDKTIYMDRYMTQKRGSILQAFKTMDTCRKTIGKSRQRIEELKRDDNNLTTDKRDLLKETLAYFESQNQEDDNISVLKQLLKSVENSITTQLEQLEEIIHTQREQMHTVFNVDEMKENPYDLRASFHTDGKSGTGHYWAYIWVEPSEYDLLEDVPFEGSWYKFCDASVTLSSESEVLNETTPPFSLIYASSTIPHYTKTQVEECIPMKLKEFIAADNTALEEEIHTFNHPVQVEDTSFVSTPEDQEPYATTEQTDDMESVIFDDNTSVGTAVNQTTEYNEAHQYSFTGQGFVKLKERVNSKIIQVAAYPKNDARLLKSFEDFLARTQNQLLLEHLYLLYSSEEVINDTEIYSVDEEASKSDEELKPVWKEYNAFLDMGETITRALEHFVQADYQHALQALLDTKRQEATWKTQMLLDLDTANTFHGLASISFHDIVEIFGKQCLKILNHNAFQKASTASYCTRGLEEAVRIAYQAQTIIGPDQMRGDSVYQSLGELWLTFTEQEAVSLNDTQANLLNTLVLTYLEGQSTDGTIQSRSQSPVPEYETEQDTQPLYLRYAKLCSDAEQFLNNT